MRRLPRGRGRRGDAFVLFFGEPTPPLPYRPYAKPTGCDPAREILEANSEPRWSNLQHYFAGVEEKEKAKAYYGFAQVPFYVVLNDKGEVVQKGSAKKVDLDAAPGAIRIVEEEDQEEKKEDRVLDFDDDF